jgi:hypothetical protein
MNRDSGPHAALAWPLVRYFAITATGQRLPIETHQRAFADTELTRFQAAR